MKLNRIFAALVILAASATASFAANGTIFVSWDGCGTTINKTITGGTPVDAYVYVTGQTDTTQSYEVWTYGGSPGGIQDAWRFDPTGCEGSAFFTLNHLAPAAVIKTCPSIQGNLPSLQIKDYAYDPTTGKARIVLANAYPNNGYGNGAATGGGKEFLANYHFDLTFATVGPTDPVAGTCGGVGVPVCWVLVKTGWLQTDFAGAQEIFWNHGQDFITSNDALNSYGCPLPVPAQAKTWGELKNQYRN